MSAARDPRSTRRPQAPATPSPDEAASAHALERPEIDGIALGPAQSRSGEDVRRRGWFWHWNSIVTQYAPLIGLKGVGLLNSYTVWTDRREESPHRGYAFPSQQREADFYGEDRAELITINKILVALDLIEIRKEMVLRADEQGRRWKVPHNFYRVKDHHDGAGLTTRDVLRVAELADREAAVYRYVRRVFSPKFAPIDRDNVWSQILEEVREIELWQRLSARATKEEDRASARTKAGHAARKNSLGTPGSVDTATPTPLHNDSDVDSATRSDQTSVASINTGLVVNVDGANSGLEPLESTSVGLVNSALPTVVDQSNTTYDQSSLTTTTTTGQEIESELEYAAGPIDSLQPASQRSVTSVEPAVTGRSRSGPGGTLAPLDAPAMGAAIQAFEDANSRRSTPAERTLLGELSDRFDGLVLGDSARSGWDALTAAIYEAVEAGSAFVAPRRLREILTRWEREGGPGADGRGRRAGEPETMVDLALDETASDFTLPHGFGSRRTWAFAAAAVAQALAPKTARELLADTAIVGYADGMITLSAGNDGQAARLRDEYGPLVARKLGEAMRRPVRIEVRLAEAQDVPIDDALATAEEFQPPEAAPRSRTVADGVFVVQECGLPSPQVWAAVLDEVEQDPHVGPVDHAAWLRGTRLLGRGAEGSLVVGAVHPLAQRRIAGRFGASLQRAVTAVLGVERPLEIVVLSEWQEHHGGESEVA